jgi:hypothetical protein
MVEEFSLAIEPFVGLARIIRAADTGKLDRRGVAVACLGTPATSAGGTSKNMGAGIDEAPDEPKTGHADNLWSGSRHPDRSSLIVTPRNPRRSHQRLTGTHARRRSHLQGFELQDFRSQAAPLTRRPALAQHDNVLSGVSCAPMRAGNELRTELNSSCVRRSASRGARLGDRQGGRVVRR